MQTYTKKSNAVRGAKRAGLTADAVKPVAGQKGVWFVDGADGKPRTKRKAKDVKAAKPSRKGQPRVKAQPGTLPREGSKNRTMIDLLLRRAASTVGATMAQLVNATEWKPPTIRTAIQRVCPAYGLDWGSVKGEGEAPTRWFAWPKGEARPC